MTPEEVGARLTRLLGGADDMAPVASVSGGGKWARATVDVPASRWRDALRTARDDAELHCDFFDWLSAVDELDEGYRVVTHVWSTTRRRGILIRCLLPREKPALSSIVDLFPGAAWHERETHEMFGIDFPGHPGLAPLLLPPEFEGHPLRKEFVLAARVAKPWPGAKEPGESHDATAARRQPMRPPGVPDPNEWGPQAGQLPPAAPARPRRAPAEGRPAPERRAAPEGRAAGAPAERRTPPAERRTPPGERRTPPGERRTPPGERPARPERLAADPAPDQDGEAG
jgi:NADH-quinone oxidoreductase subunit C